MIIDSATPPFDAKAYDRKGAMIPFLVMVDTDAMEGEQLTYFDPGPPPVSKTRRIRIWLLTWNGMRFERNRKGRIGRVFNTGRKMP